VIRSGQPAGLDALIAAGEATLAVGTDPREWWTGQEAVLAAFRAQLADGAVPAYWQSSLRTPPSPHLARIPAPPSAGAAQ
jgi:hypothetical protein